MSPVRRRRRRTTGAYPVPVSDALLRYANIAAGVAIITILALLGSCMTGAL